MAQLPEKLLAPPLELHRLGPEHIDGVMSAIAASAAELGRWLPWADPPPRRDVEAAFLVGRQQAFEADQGYGFALIETETGQFVGTAGLQPKRPNLAEIGYWVRRDRTRRGYATLAARTLTAAAFAHLPDVAKVIIRMDKANHASAAVPRKLGFVLEDSYEDREILTSGHSGTGLIWSQFRP